MLAKELRDLLEEIMNRRKFPPRNKLTDIYHDYDKANKSWEGSYAYTHKRHNRFACTQSWSQLRHMSQWKRTQAGHSLSWEREY